MDKNKIFLIQTGEKRFHYYKCISFKHDETEIIYKFTYVRRYKSEFTAYDNKYKGCRLHYKSDNGKGWIYGIIKKIDKAELCQTLMEI